MNFHANSLRKASAADGFPYRQRHVTFLRIGEDGQVTQAKHVQGKQLMLCDLSAGDLLLAAWTGSYTTDIFVVDDVVAARDALV
jgi:hypothetical protein